MLGNPVVDKIIMALNVIGVFAAIGLTAYSNMFMSRELPNNRDEFAALEREAREEGQIEVFKVDKIAMNLYSRANRLRFLSVEFHIQPFKKKHLQVLEEKKAVVIDTMIDVTGHMTPQELNSVAGKILLESRVKKRLNTQIGYPIAKKIYFSTFIIQ